MSFDITENPEGRKPNNLLNYIRWRFARPGEFPSIVEPNGDEILELLQCESPPPCLEEALFIIDLNGFRQDLIRIVNLCSRISLINDAVSMEWAAQDGHRGLVENFIRRAHDFYHVTHNYQKHFGLTDLFPSISGELFSFNIFSKSPFFYKVSDAPLLNMKLAYDSFKSCQPAFKNFLNVFYGDGEVGMNLLKREFKSLMSDYQWIEAGAEDLNRIFKSAGLCAAEEKNSKLYKELDGLLEKYPATVFRSMEVMFEYIKCCCDEAGK